MAAGLKNSSLWITGKIDCDQTLAQMLVESGLIEFVPRGQPILIKPNLVEALPPPITTEVRLVSRLISILRHLLPTSRVLVGEGTGAIEYQTGHCFETLGYRKMADELDVELIDLNVLPPVVRRNQACTRWPEMHLPALLDEVFLLSVPVLKAHSLAGVTLTMKNMMGCVPPAVYRRGASWGKSAFHERIQEAIFDLNRYRRPDFTVLDARIGMAKAHLWGPHCDPPVGRLVAGRDPVAIDSCGCHLLRVDWQTIGHIQMADGELGNALQPTMIEL